MKINKMYEIAEVVRYLQLEGEASALPLFGHLAFHQCPSYDTTIKSGAWPWGALVMDTATHHWTDTGLWKGPNEINVIELNKDDSNWTCFEDLYFETSYNSWYPAPQYQDSWLRTLHKTVEESLPSTSTPAPASEQGIQQPKASLAERCRTRNLRIHLFERSSGSSLRKFANLEQVRTVLANFTSVPISVVTVNATTPLSEQIEAFRAFDVLVTSHGRATVDREFHVQHVGETVQAVKKEESDTYYIAPKALLIFQPPRFSLSVLAAILRDTREL